MFGRCRHQWREVQRVVEPPVGHFKIDQFQGREMIAFLERAMHGATLIEQRCEHCGKTEVLTVIGQIRQP